MASLNLYNKDTAVVLQINAQSIKTIDREKNKLVQFQSLVDLKAPDIISVCESWLIEAIKDNDILLTTEFTIHRKDRKHKEGGGVFVAVKNHITSTHRKDLEPTDELHNEIIIVEVIDGNGEKTGIISVYRPPNETNFLFVSNLRTCLLNAWRAGMHNLLVLGDFNLTDVNWEVAYPTNDAGISYACCELFQEFGLEQLNQFASRLQTNNILDIILTNNEDWVTNIDAYRQILDTDHAILQFNYQMFVPPAVPVTRKIYNFKLADFVKLSDTLRQSNLVPLDSLDVDVVADHWTKSVINILDKSIPVLSIKSKTGKPWIDSQVRHQSNISETARRKFKKDNRPANWIRYREANKTLKYMIRHKYNEYVVRCASFVDSNPKKFWNFAKRNNKGGTYPSKMSWNQSVAETAEAKANLFNSYFSSVFTPPAEDEILPEIDAVFNPNLSSVQVEVAYVTKLLSDLDPAKATGPDNIPAKVLKFCAASLGPSVTHIINLSLASGRVPSCWKHANVCPIFKKGSKIKMENYRPISLLPICSKILEKCVYNSIINEIEPRFHKLQHGFRPGLSVTTQLVQVYDDVSRIADNRGQIDAIFLDFSKAFDSVSHSLLVHKLKTFGINGTLLQWFSNYLRKRTQSTVIEGVISAPTAVLSGVPQGSILGPVLFLLFINDMPSGIDNKCRLALYADDAKLYMQIKDINDCITLQHQLQHLEAWSIIWKLRFNSDKCKYMSLTRKVTPFQYKYVLNGKNLEKVHEFKDLGVIIESNLSWDKQIASQVKAANRMLYYVKRILGLYAPREAKMRLYTSLVRSHLEFATVVWSPTTLSNLKLLESVQRRATKFILNDKYTDYNTRLTQCNLLPLSYRREYIDVMFTHKAAGGVFGENIKGILPTTDPNLRRARHANTFTMPMIRTESFSHFYTNRIVAIWNNLPDLLRSMKYEPNSRKFRNAVLNYFKSKLHTYDPLNPCTWVTKCRCAGCRPV